MAISEHQPNKKNFMQYAAILAGFATLLQLVFMDLTPFKNIALMATQNIAGIIGMEGEVPPNEYNGLAAQFEEKDKELALREQALQLREQALSSGNDRITIRVLFGVTFLLLLLLIINFYLDWRRGGQVSDKTPDHHNELTTRL